MRNEIDILNRELQTKEATIRKLEGLIEKLQEDANIRRLTIDAQARIVVALYRRSRLIQDRIRQCNFWAIAASFALDVLLVLASDRPPFLTLFSKSMLFLSEC